MPEDFLMNENEYDISKYANQFANQFVTGVFDQLKKESDLQRRENVAIFVDYDNVYWTLMNMYNHDPDHEDPEKNLFIHLWNKYGRDHVRSFRVYANFEKVRTSLTSLQKKRIQIRHVYSKDRYGDERKNASDIEMCIDIVETTYKDPSITCYVNVTADSDMIPIISRLVYKGKRVELFYLSEAAPKHIDMSSFAHESFDLVDVLNVEVVQYDLNKYVTQALKFIYEWNKKHQGKTNVWLGASWLRDQLCKLLSIPSNVASDLIELLKTSEYITEENRETDKGIKRSINITRKGDETLAPELTKEEVASAVTPTPTNHC